MSEDLPVIKVSVDPCGIGEVTLNGVKLDGLTGVSIKTKAGEPNEISLSFFGDLEIETQVNLEKAGISREQIVRMNDGRILKAMIGGVS